jgi:hypothetical protein
MIIDRYIRLRDAPGYLGMDKDRFNAEVRPTLIEIPIGIQGIAFDRLDLDAWADEYKSRNGRPGKQKGGNIWDAKTQRQGSELGTEYGTLTRDSKRQKAGGFDKALVQVTYQRRNGT